MRTDADIEQLRNEIREFVEREVRKSSEMSEYLDKIHEKHFYKLPVAQRKKIIFELDNACKFIQHQCDIRLLFGKYFH